MSRTGSAAELTEPTVRCVLRARSLNPPAPRGAPAAVLYLYLVEGLEANGETTHPVYFDSHRWYCTHGANCAAVAVARRAHRRHGRRERERGRRSPRKA